MTSNDSLLRDEAHFHSVAAPAPANVTTTWTIQGAPIQIDVINGQVYVNGDLVQPSEPHGTPFLPKTD